MPITTEFDWLTCVNPREFAAFCHGRVSPSRYHQLNVCWGQRVRHLMGSIGRDAFDAYAEWVATGGVGVCQFPEQHYVPFITYRGAVQDAESFAELLRRRDWLRAAACVAEAASEDFPFPGEPRSDPAHSHKKKCKKAMAGIAAGQKEARERWERGREAHREQTLWQFANEFRDVAGNPFRPVAFDPAWRTETVVGLAAGIDEAGAYERLPILADALEEAGCTDAQVLSHARNPGVHVRWLIDMILGRFA